MAETFTSLIIGTLDELSRILNLQELLRIALDEFHEPTETTSKRLEVLLVCYLSQTEPHFNNLKLGLERVLQLAGNAR